MASYRQELIAERYAARWLPRETLKGMENPLLTITANSQSSYRLSSLRPMDISVLPPLLSVGVKSGETN